VNDGSRFEFDVVGVGANSVDYVYRLPRFPQPDSPAAKLRITQHLVTCGGQTATALCTCAAMGLRTKYIGAIGNDPNGDRLRGELASRGMDLEHISVRDAINPFAVILLDGHGERVVLWERAPGLELRHDALDSSLIRGARLLHVDDVDEEAAIEAARLGREAGIPVTSDIERVTARTEELVASVTVPIFAEHVPEALTGEHDLERALRKLRKVRLKPDTTYTDTTYADTAHQDATRGAGLICVTMGARGAMLLAGDVVYHEPGRQVDVADTTGAGDVFRGAFIVALLRGDAPDDMLRFANAAAAVSCTRIGAIPSVPTLDETMSLVSRL
jgi:sugar/nucleoside kinase (ribokinase family)